MLEFERIALAVLLALLFLLFTWYCYHRQGWRFGSNVRLENSDTVIAYASQSGRAHALAEQCWQSFSGQAQLLKLNQLNEKLLSKVDRILIFASTYGEGEAPDNGAVFEQRILSAAAAFSLEGKEFAVIALGDSHYPNFCSFGHKIHAGLKQLGARPLTDCIELDASKPEQEHKALQQLKSVVSALGGSFNADRAEHRVIPERYCATLISRQLLNKGSPGAPLYCLRFTVADTLNYSAGDIVEIVPRHNAELCKQKLAQLGFAQGTMLMVNHQSIPAWQWLAGRQWPLPGKPDSMSAEQWLLELPEEAPRQYTIANAYLPHEIQLVVRQQRSEMGDLGLASGWLTRHLGLNEQIELAIRDNQEFHTPPADQPLILIGNGSGIAGLRAHLQHRAITGGEPCWLLYGERDACTDRPFADELSDLQKRGVLQFLDCAYSRAEHPEYVQQRLLQRKERLLDWLGCNACIYVCGSRLGMGQGVHQVLLDLLGEKRVEELQAAGRYRRDVY